MIPHDEILALRGEWSLAGCSHHVEEYGARRESGLLPSRLERAEPVKLIDRFLPKLKEWVERSCGKIRGDVVFDKLAPVGFDGPDRRIPPPHHLPRETDGSRDDDGHARPRSIGYNAAMHRRRRMSGDGSYG